MNVPSGIYPWAGRDPVGRRLAVGFAHATSGGGGDGGGGGADVSSAASERCNVSSDVVAHPAAKATATRASPRKRSSVRWALIRTPAIADRRRVVRAQRQPRPEVELRGAGLRSTPSRCRLVDRSDAGRP